MLLLHITTLRLYYLLQVSLLLPADAVVAAC
jgi:hypothetical protein